MELVVEPISWLQEILGVSKWKENIKKEEGEVLKPLKIEGTSRQKMNFGDRWWILIGQPMNQ